MPLEAVKRGGIRADCATEADQKRCSWSPERLGGGLDRGLTCSRPPERPGGGCDRGLACSRPPERLGGGCDRGLACLPPPERLGGGWDRGLARAAMLTFSLLNSKMSVDKNESHEAYYETLP